MTRTMSPLARFNVLRRNTFSVANRAKRTWEMVEMETEVALMTHSAIARTKFSERITTESVRKTV